MPSYLDLPDRRLAYLTDGPAAVARPGLFFLPGYFSDMMGSKAVFLAAQGATSGLRTTRLDYRGHGQSSGTFTDYVLSDWLADALEVFDRVTTGPQIVVGSSMGGWLMLLLALRRPERVAGLVGIAAAPDFTETMLWQQLDPAQQAAMQREGVYLEPSTYSPEPTPFTYNLVLDGRQHLLLGQPLAISAPMRLLQGQHDKEVPWQTALQIAGQAQSADVHVTLVKDGEHRLSRPGDLALLWRNVEEMLAAPR